MDSSAGGPSSPAFLRATRKSCMTCSAMGPWPVMRDTSLGSFSRPPRIAKIRLTIFSLRSGTCRSSQSRNRSFTPYGRRRGTQLASVAPLSDAAMRIEGISWSVSPGITGATKTVTGTPAWASCSIASSLRSGLDVRGSMALWRAGSNVVTETATFAAR